MLEEVPARRGGDDQPRTATRPEQAAEQVAALAASAEPGTRLGTKGQLRAYCGVSVGTFNEALRLVQARGVVTVRPGRAGGLFASRQSALVRLGNSMLALDDDDAALVADALRIRNALDPLLVEDALRHASRAQVALMEQELDRMRQAVGGLDSIEFIHANWALHALIAETSPNVILRSFYLSLLEIIKAHTLSVQPVEEQPLQDYIKTRYQLHAQLVAAIADRDAAHAAELIDAHNTTTSTRPFDSHHPASVPTA